MPCWFKTRKELKGRYLQRILDLLGKFVSLFEGHQ
jgi:hypothetical protein